MKKAILVDSNSLLYRAFYALPRLTTNDGVPTGGIYGFLRIISKLLAEPHSHFVVVGDSAGPLSRSVVLKEYKTNRPKAPDELSSQRNMLPDILGKLSIPYFVINGKEADDSIASLVSFFERWGFSVDIYTSDSDMFQLISDRTNVITFKKGITDSKRYDVSLFEKEFSFHPNRYVDYKSLVGDQADNIPGVNGIGPKTAASLVKEFDTGQLIDRFGDVFRRNLDLIRLEQFEVPLNVFLCRVKPCTDFSVLEQLQFQSLTPSYRKLLEPIVAQTGLFGLENVDTLPWQQLTDRIDVKEPFPFAFVSGNEPLFSSALLYAESNWKLKNESIPVNVFLNGEKVDISAGVTVALLNACSTCKLEGDTLWLQV